MVSIGLQSLSNGNKTLKHLEFSSPEELCPLDLEEVLGGEDSISVNKLAGTLHVHPKLLHYWHNSRMVQADQGRGWERSYSPQRVVVVLTALALRKKSLSLRRMRDMLPLVEEGVQQLYTLKKPVRHVYVNDAMVVLSHSAAGPHYLIDL